MEPLAVTKSAAAVLLSVSVEFFDAHVAPEVRCVTRDGVSIYPVSELEEWLTRNAKRRSGGQRGTPDRKDT